MKIAIIGGGGVRTPLLVRGLVASDLPLTEIALYDTDRERLALIAPVARRFAGPVALCACESSADCIAGADYVFTSIRVGGAAARARDEAIALAHGVVGQETVGPAGFAMAMRTVPTVVHYAREVEWLAPRAWIINFTNPVGIVTQAVRTETAARIIGICDTPTELFEEVVRALGLDSSLCSFDYFGLNHLGWLREVYFRGDPQLHRLWDDPQQLARIYRAPLFEPDFLLRLRLLPTEYLYYYYRSTDAVRHLRGAGRTRGQVIEALNDALIRDLGAPAANPATVYDAYLAARNAGYMQLESGALAPLPASPSAALTGYDKIAVAVVRAIHFNTGAVLPLNVSNQGNLPELEHEDVVEVPCVVNANGAHPLHVGPAPTEVRALLTQVKEYERLTLRAALAGDRDAASRALARHPLVGSADLARDLVAALGVGGV